MHHTTKKCGIQDPGGFADWRVFAILGLYFIPSMEVFAAFDAFLLIVWSLLLLLGRVRRSLLLASIFAIPLVVFATLIQPEYYDPPAFTSSPIDVERLFFLFLAGGIAATIYPALTRQHFRPITNGRNMWPERVFVPLGILMVILLPPVIFGMSALHSLVLGEIVGILLVVWIGRDLRNTMLGSALVVGLGYFLSLLAWEALFPQALSPWSVDAFWGLRLIGVPAGEIILATLFGALWGPLVSLILHQHVSKERNATKTQLPASGHGEIIVKNT